MLETVSMDLPGSVPCLPVMSVRMKTIRSLITGKQGTEPGRSIDTVSNTGQYL